ATVPFDIVFHDKANDRWIYASRNFCYEFEGSTSASDPLPAGLHQVTLPITDVYTWNGGSLPSDAAINSIIFISKAPGTITVKRCVMGNGQWFVKAYPDTVYQLDGHMIRAVPIHHTVGEFCQNARRQFDTTGVTVKKTGSAYIGTGDSVKFANGSTSETYTAVVRGDLDGSGTITTVDTRMLLKSCIGASDLSEAQQAASDLVTDWVINTTDVRLMLARVIASEEMTFTQEQVIATETYLSESKYQTFLSAAQRGTRVAGLTNSMVPQGLTQSQTTNLTYVSAYSSNNGCSAITVYDVFGRFRAEYLLRNEDGSMCKKHLGGLAVTDTTLFVSFDSSTAYRVAAIPLASLVTVGTQTVTVPKVYEVPVTTSFLSYYGGYLWIGNFYLPSAGYDLTREINYTTPAGSEQYGSYIVGYDMRTRNEQRLTPASGQSYATPDVVLAAPQKVQGMVYDTKNRKVILSQSWGRKNDSTLQCYSLNIYGSADTTITLNGTAVPCFVLMSPAKTVTALPMAEGITLDEPGNVRILFESGAEKYSDGLHRTDCIWRFRY
ncbi:MAG: dockerin type I repeat-containing protein, partial [Clostridia bacterium]|nr:dockerin type I repeat-containing protein [Clostridia bacterium]